MKKILLMAIVAAVGLTSCQSKSESSAECDSAKTITLKDAFDELSKIQNVTITAPDYNLPVVADVVKDGKIAAAYNLDAAQTLATGQSAFEILNKVPMSYIINGGSNGEVAAYVYVTPTESNRSDILIAAMSGYKGSFVYMYGTIDSDDAKAIQATPMNMEGNYLSIEARMPDGSDFNIILSKAR